MQTTIRRSSNIVKRFGTTTPTRYFGTEVTHHKSTEQRPSIINDLRQFRIHHQAFLDLVKDHGEGSFKVIRKGPVIELQICNSAKKNAISGKMMNELSERMIEIFEEIKKDDDLIALVIRGEGEDVFASGADLTLVSEVLTSPQKGVMMSSYMTPLMSILRDCPLIVVNYLNGFVVGGGAEMSTIGDFRIMADKTGSGKANFIQFVHARIGASPGWGGGGRLTNIVGRRHALRLLGTSMRTSAEEALSIGLVDMIHHREQKSADEAILDFLRPYLEQPYPKSVRAMKRIVRAVEPAVNPLAQQMELKQFSERWQSKDNIMALMGTPDKKKRPKE